MTLHSELTGEGKGGVESRRREVGGEGEPHDQSNVRPPSTEAMVPPLRSKRLYPLEKGVSSHLVAAVPAVRAAITTRAAAAWTPTIV